ncbi:MAG: DUF2892 domain-containing protein [Gammaproteobacteria bacterium]|nr:DUF2892 domain-containing protein [Gammaproteobacteria bacterium]
MFTDTKKLGALQNVGLWDRILRVIIGSGLIAVVLVDLYQRTDLGWHAYLPIIAIYPMLTGILGFDPLYSSVNYRTCDSSMRNRCGTFPFEVEAAFGKDVKCDETYHDCSLSGNDHVSGSKTSHA